MARNPEYNQYHGTPRRIHDKAVDRLKRLEAQVRLMRIESATRAITLERIEAKLLSLGEPSDAERSED